MRHLLLLLTVIVLPLSAAAQITSVGVSGASYHFDRSEDWNEINPGLHLTIDEQWVVGVFENSRSKRVVYEEEVLNDTITLRSPTSWSFYAGYSLKWEPIPHLSLRAQTGFVSGYREYPIPFVVGVVGGYWKNIQLDTIIFPFPPGIGIMANIKID